MKHFYLILCFYFLSNIAYSQKVGVVLSGGGAAGSAHVGVLKALEEKNIPIDYIVGTSVGAIIGGFYAAGYSPAEIEKIVNSAEFKASASGIINENELYYIKRSDDNSSIFNLYFNLDSILGTNLPTNFVNSAAIDYGLMEFFSPANAVAKENFDSLMVPYRALAANITKQKQTILKEGNLSTAIRASMTYPFYIAPISIDGNIMFDGGLYNNFPVDIMCNEFFPDYIIASNVATKNASPTEENLISQLRNILTKEVNFELTCAKGVIINSDVSDISTFDFYETDKALKRGYTSTINLMDSIYSIIPSRRTLDEVQFKRTNFKKKIPPLVFDSIAFAPQFKSQGRYFKRSLNNNEGVIGSNKIRPAYYRLTSNEKIKSAYPTATFNEKTGAYKLDLNIKKEKNFKASIGGVIASKPISTGFVQLEHNLIRATELKTSGNIYFGNFYNSVEGRVRWDIPFDIPFYVESQFTANRYDYYNGFTTFIEENDPPFILNSEQFVESKIGLPVFTNGKIVGGINFFWQEYEYYQSDDFVRGDTSDVTSFNGNKAFIMYERNSLNRKQYASKGNKWSIKVANYHGLEKTFPGTTSPNKTTLKADRNWLNINLMLDKYFFSKRSFHLGTYLEMNYSEIPQFHNYTASLFFNPSFSPIPESQTLFQPQYRSRTFTAIGLKTVYSYRDALDFRAEVYYYQPYEQLMRNPDGSSSYGEEVTSRDVIGTFTTVYHTAFGPFAASLNYYGEAQDNFSILVHFGYILFNKKAFD